MKKIHKISFLVFACLLLFSSICMATDTLSVTEANSTTTESEANPTLSMMNSDLYFGGDEVVVEQPIDGNVFIVANTVTLKGEINGNAFIVAQTLNVEESATVYHSLFAVAANMTMAGSTYDIYALASNFTLAESAYLERDLKLAGNKVSLNGYVRRDAYIAAETITMSENDKVMIGGNLHYTSGEEKSFPEKAIGGEVNFTKVDVSEPTIGEIISSYVMEGLMVVLYMTLIIVLATFFAPKFIHKACYVATKRPFATAGIGILAIIFIPIFALLIMMTGILAFVGIGVLVLYFLVLSITLSILSMAIAKAITLKLKNETKGKFILLSIASALVIWLLQQVPYIGGYISLFTVVFGLGIFVFAFFSKKQIEKSEK